MTPNNNVKIIPLISIAALVAIVEAMYFGNIRCGNLCNNILAMSTILSLISASLYGFAGGFIGLNLAGSRMQLALLYSALIINMIAVAMGFAIVRTIGAILALASTAIIATTIIVGLIKSS